MLLVENVFAEELVFRSYLLSFINENWGNISAISITSILFIFYHSKPRIIELGVMGITFGVLVIITNNIITPIMAHLSINLIYLGNKYKKNKKKYIFYVIKVFFYDYINKQTKFSIAFSNSKYGR